MRRERGEKILCAPAKPGSRIVRTGLLQQVIAGLQLGEVFDTLADTSLKCFLQRKAHAGNADRGTSCMQGVGKRGIKFSPKADQAGRVRGGEFENTRKSGGRFEQAGPVAGLGTGFAFACRKLG